MQSRDTASTCDRQTVNSRQSDTYRGDDASTLPPTPLHDHTSSLPCRVPGTSSMHAGCHSRRMTGFSSTMPFPLFTLNCYTHTHPPPRLPGPLGLTVSWLRFPQKCTHTHRQQQRHTHTHTCTLAHVHT